MNTPKFSVEDLTLAEERDPVYVNLDAAWLQAFSRKLGGAAVDGYAGDEDLLRLRIIADRLERLDEKFRNLQGDDAYAAGIREGRLRQLRKSNLPIQAVEITNDLRAAVAKFDSAKIKKVATVKTTSPPVKSVLSVAGIKLNLGGLK